jgi:hypothetical protein
MPINWIPIYNRLFALIDRKGESYFKGSRFITKVRTVDPYFPDYNQYIDERRSAGKSTSRKEYFYDILLDFEESARIRIVSNILDDVEHCDPDLATEIRSLMGESRNAPRVVIHAAAWNASRLNNHLADIDAAVAAGQYARAVNLSYTCLEGFYIAFIQAKDPSYALRPEIIALSRWIRDYLRNVIRDCPDEVLNLLTHISHAVDRARNRFSEAHFGSEAGFWLATYVRDLVNTQIRLLLNFMEQ